MIKNKMSSQSSTALDKQGYLMIIRDYFCQFRIETYVVTPHLNCLNETVQMRITTYSFNEEYENYPSIIIKYSLIYRAMSSGQSSF